MRCAACGLDRDASAFRVERSGRVCRACRSKRQRHEPRRLLRHPPDPTVASLTCTGCGKTKAARFFRKDSTALGGRRRECLACRRAYRRRINVTPCPDCGAPMSKDRKRCKACAVEAITARRQEAEAERLATDQALRAAWMREPRIVISIAVANAAQNLAAIHAKMAERRRRAIELRERPVTPRRAREWAREAVRSALRSGTLVRPDTCQRCDEVAPVQGHHHSYLREDWLKVEWLCQRCHGRLHRAMQQRGESVRYPPNVVGDRLQK